MVTLSFHTFWSWLVDRCEDGVSPVLPEFSTSSATPVCVCDHHCMWSCESGCMTRACRSSVCLKASHPVKYDAGGTGGWYHSRASKSRRLEAEPDAGSISGSPAARCNDARFTSTSRIGVFTMVATNCQCPTSTLRRDAGFILKRSRDLYRYPIIGWCQLRTMDRREKEQNLRASLNRGFWHGWVDAPTTFGRPSLAASLEGVWLLKP